MRLEAIAEECEDLTAENEALLEALEEQEEEIQQLTAQLQEADFDCEDLSEVIFNKMEELALIEEELEEAKAQLGDQTIAEAQARYDQKDAEIIELEARLNAEEAAKVPAPVIPKKEEAHVLKSLQYAMDRTKENHNKTLDNLNGRVSGMKKLIADIKNKSS